MEVLAFIDDCGHQHVIDVSTPEQQLRVYTAMLADAIDGDYVYGGENRAVADRLVMDGTNCLNAKREEDYQALADEIYDFAILDGHADIQLGFRDGFGPFEVTEAWVRNCY